MLRLSSGVANNPSVAALGIVAQEVGHAVPGGGSAFLLCASDGRYGAKVVALFAELTSLSMCLN